MDVKFRKMKELHAIVQVTQMHIRKLELLTLALQDSLGLLWKHE